MNLDGVLSDGWFLNRHVALLFLWALCCKVSRNESDVFSLIGVMVDQGRCRERSVS